MRIYTGADKKELCPETNFKTKHKKRNLTSAFSLFTQTSGYVPALFIKTFMYERFASFQIWYINVFFHIKEFSR